MKQTTINNILGALHKGANVDPHAECNQDKDFQDGYEKGLRKGQDSADLISGEWKRRGCPQECDPGYKGFKRWKEGMWVGVFTRT